MKKSIMIAAIVSVTILAIGSFARPSRTADGFYLRWTSTGVNTNSVRNCFGFGSDVMRSQGFQNVRQSPEEVTGWRGGTYAVITCIGTTPRATAVIMAVGGNDGEASQVRDFLREKMAGIIHP